MDIGGIPIINRAEHDIIENFPYNLIKKGDSERLQFSSPDAIEQLSKIHLNKLNFIYDKKTSTYSLCYVKNVKKLRKQSLFH